MLVQARPEGWMLTLGLSALALLAALIAPRALSAQSEATAEAAATCVRVGPYECCYDPQDP